MAYKKFTASEDMLKPDPRFNSKLVSKFINSLMWDGKKTVAMKLFYGAMDQIAKKNKEGGPAPLEVFEGAINNVKPYVEVRSKRVGGANYQVPMQVNKRRQQSLAFRWIIGACREAGGRPMADRLADELMAAFKKEGKAMTTREQTHRMADANKAFAHFAW
jgi:small subunit ribosomal protein S7